MTRRTDRSEHDREREGTGRLTAGRTGVNICDQNMFSRMGGH